MLDPSASFCISIAGNSVSARVRAAVSPSMYVTYLPVPRARSAASAVIDTLIATIFLGETPLRLAAESRSSWEAASTGVTE